MFSDHGSGMKDSEKSATRATMDAHDMMWCGSIGNRVTASENILNQVDRILTGNGGRKLNHNIECTFQKLMFSKHGSGMKVSEESANRATMDEHATMWCHCIGNFVIASKIAWIKPIES